MKMALSQAERDKVLALLGELGMAYADPQTNFVFFQHRGISTALFRAEMAADGLQVARDFPPYNDWCRISIGSPNEMRLARASIKRIVTEVVPTKTAIGAEVVARL